MGGTFAHLSDIHLGAFRDLRLREESLRTFCKAMDVCIQRKVDFLLLAGDLFHVSLPDMAIVRAAAEKFREVRNAGIRIYAVYGSHDYAPNEVAVLDVLQSAGLFEKVVRPRDGPDGSLQLDFVEDPTGVRIAGLSGRARALERFSFDALDLKPMEEAPGFRVFLFHSGVTEHMPGYVPASEGIPLSMFPKGFQYYAGGHIHETFSKQVPGYGLFGQPGALFGSGFTDLEHAVTRPRGFYVLHWEDRTIRQEFVPVPERSVVLEEVDAAGRTPEQVNQRLAKVAERAETDGRIVLLRIAGELSTGRIADLDTDRTVNALEERGAFAVALNRHQLRARRPEQVPVEAANQEEIERSAFHELSSKFPGADASLTGAGGVATAHSLLHGLREERPDGMVTADHRRQLLAHARRILDLQLDEGVDR